METMIASAAQTAEAACFIRNGGLVVFPTETVYGLGASALDAEAAKKIYAAKGRPSDNPLICHFARPEDVERYCETSPLFYRLAERFMPGPLTVILPKKTRGGEPIIPDTVTGGLSSVGVRVPSNPIARDFIDKCGVPIAAPSANLSGTPSPTTLRHVLEDMYGRADCIIDGGDSEIGVESTIVLPKSDGSGVKLLRPGGITAEMLEQLCGSVEIDPSVSQKFDGVPLAPGMKYRHYAPKAKVIMLDGSDEAVYAFLADKRNCGILCYDGDTPLLNHPFCQTMGAKDNHAAQAHRLFACLRDFHDVETIYARMPARDGVGLAVFNRLIKAAGYDILPLDEPSSH